MKTDLAKINNNSNKNEIFTMLSQRQVLDLGSNTLGSPGSASFLTANAHEKRHGISKGNVGNI